MAIEKNDLGCNEVRIEGVILGEIICPEYYLMHRHQVFYDWLEKEKSIIIKLGKEIESRKHKAI